MNITVKQLDNLKTSEEAKNLMVKYFDENLRPTAFIQWLGTSIEKTSRFIDKHSPQYCAISFMSDFFIYLIPDLIEVKNNNERIKVLNNRLIDIFNSSTYDGNKEIIKTIAEAYLIEYSTRKSDYISEFEFFTETLNHLITLNEIFSFYKQLNGEEI